MEEKSLGPWETSKMITLMKDSSALHFAAALGDAVLVQVLLAAGADPAVRDSRGNRPEDVASGAAKKFLSARRQALEEESELLDCQAPARASPRSSAL